MSESVLYDPEQTGRLLDQFLDRLSDLVMTSDGCDEPWALVGIHRRGDVLAGRLRQRIIDRGGPELELGVLDITLYRDDFSLDRPQPTVRPSEISFAVDSAKILLIDDVFFTGRTIRAALTQLADFGRPRRVVLGVFVDRNMRELPIRPDHFGIGVDRPREEQVQLRLAEVDDDQCDQIVVRAARKRNE